MVLFLLVKSVDEIRDESFFTVPKNKTIEYL